LTQVLKKVNGFRLLALIKLWIERDLVSSWWFDSTNK